MRIERLGCALPLSLLAACVATSPPQVTSASNLPPACAEVRAVAEARTNIGAAEEVRVGYWPEASLCQMLVVNQRQGAKARVTYVWLGLPGARGARTPLPGEPVDYEADVAQNGDISFTTHWGATIVYSQDGRAQYIARPGAVVNVGYARRN